MQIDFINGFLREGLEVFKFPNIKATWDVMMFLESGSCKVSCGNNVKPFELHAGEIALLPTNTEIHREALSEEVSEYYQIPQPSSWGEDRYRSSRLQSLFESFGSYLEV